MAWPKRFDSRLNKRKRRQAPAFSFVVPASSFIWSPPPVPLEPIPEPFDSRWSLSGHIRYIRLGTRTTVTLGSATQFKLLVQEFSGSWRTPQGTIPKGPPDLSDAIAPTERGPDRASPPLRPFYA